jgi:hypothetical protein
MTVETGLTALRQVMSNLLSAVIAMNKTGSGHFHFKRQTS